MNLVWKLLKQNISKWQFAGFFAANLVGLTIVLLGIQFYTDINPLFSSEETVMKRDFIVVSKGVNMVGSLLSGDANGFSEKEIEEIRSQSFTTQVGAFTASQYMVFGGISTNRGGFRTEMFFESVPDEFLDVKTNNWQFSPDSDVVPIIIPKNYLDLYNFGYAEARSMPKLTEGVIGLVNFEITIAGKYQRREFKGNIAGFSNRINTILVPETFMKWSNENFGEQEGPVKPNRLIVEVNNPADPNIASFLQQNRYEVQGDDSSASKMAYFLKVIVILVVAVGAIICVLSFFVLTLSIFLLIEKNMEKMQNLRLIGYTKSHVVRPYELLATGMNVAILLLAMIIVVVVRIKYIAVVQTVWVDFAGAGIFSSIVTGVAVFCLLSLLNILVIRGKVR